MFLICLLLIGLVAIAMVTNRRAKKSGGDKDRDKFFTGDRYPQSI